MHYIDGYKSGNCIVTYITYCEPRVIQYPPGSQPSGGINAQHGSDEVLGCREDMYSDATSHKWSDCTHHLS